MRLNILILALVFYSVSSFSSQVLIVGDSLTCGPFGENLTVELARDGHHVLTYCSVASKAQSWIQGKNEPRYVKDQSTGKLVTKTTWPCEKRFVNNSGVLMKSSCDGSYQIPRFENLIKKYPSHNIIVALGTNSLLSKTADHYYSDMLSIISQDRTKTCLWIGPPHIERTDFEAGLNPFYKSLQTKVDFAKCKLIDSRPATALGTEGYPSVPDKLHKTPAAGKAWAKTLKKQIEAGLR